MQQFDLFQLRENFNRHRIMLCFNGPFHAALIEEIGKALRGYLEEQEVAPSAVSDVFTVYIEIMQNIRNYTRNRQLEAVAGTSIVIISQNDEGRYVVSAGNVVLPADGELVVRRVEELSTMSKDELKAAFKAQLKKPREELSDNSAGLGLIDMARKSFKPLVASLQPHGTQAFFSLSVVI